MKLARLAGAGILALVILAPALLASGSSSASGLSPQLASAPPALVPLAFQAGAMTGIDPNVLLAIAKVETHWGRARQGQRDELVPADVRAGIDAAALRAVGSHVIGGSSAGGRLPVPVPQFLPSIGLRSTPARSSMCCRPRWQGRGDRPLGDRRPYRQSAGRGDNARQGSNRSRN